MTEEERVVAVKAELEACTGRPGALALWREVEAVADQLLLVSTQVREQGDVRQVLLGADGVGQAPTLADELWAIQFNLRGLVPGGLDG